MTARKPSFRGRLAAEAATSSPTLVQCLPRRIRSEAALRFALDSCFWRAVFKLTMAVCSMRPCSNGVCSMSINYCQALLQVQGYAVFWRAVFWLRSMRPSMPLRSMCQRQHPSPLGFSPAKITCEKPRTARMFSASTSHLDLLRAQIRLELALIVLRLVIRAL